MSTAAGERGIATTRTRVVVAVSVTPCSSTVRQCY